MRILPLFVCLAVAVSAVAQTPPPAASPQTFHATRVQQAPSIDGDLSDAAWAGAEEITGFTQRDPDEGKPSTEETVVKIVYDDEAIYFGAYLHDRSKVTTVLGRRDTAVESDWFRVYLDPHLDRRTGATFQVNPANMQYD
nr:hypothetical protein [Acidobacteriota bacterium]